MTGDITAGGHGVVLACTGSAGFRTVLESAGHTLVADEPTSVGGTDTGFSPYGLLASALAACTSMTLQMYARRKGLPLEKAVVRVAHSRIHAEDCAHCETKVGRIDRLERTITLVGQLDADARQRLVAIADRCPVHRSLAGEIDIETTLAD
jgi:putative redox protein